MQNLQMVLTERLRAEWLDFELDYPEWLRSIVDDDLYYVITLITLCSCSFGLGLCIGLIWIMV